MLITSPANQHLKLARGVRDGKEPALLFAEGERLCEDLVNSDLRLMTCFYSPEPSPRTQEIIAIAQRRDCQTFAVAEEALNAVSDTVHSQGVIFLAERPAHRLEELIASAKRNSQSLVALDAVQDPGNLGTIIRTAEAAGAVGVIALSGTADTFSPKTLRSAMGSAFRLPMVSGLSGDELLAACRDAGMPTIATAADATRRYDNTDLTQAAVLILGNEANGINESLLQQCDATIAIPIRQPVNSINVAASAAVILFEAERQRRTQDQYREL